MHKRSMSYVLRLLLSGGIFAGLIWAQSASTGTLVGTLTDSSGGAIGGAKVTVVNEGTSFSSVTESSIEGNYRIPYLAPGKYRLSVEAAGFKKYLQEGIEVNAGSVPRVDAKLEIGAVTESMTVTSTPPLLETETSSSGQLLAGSELIKMPISQKTVQRMITYYPDTSSMSGVHVLGQRQNSIGYTVDGVNAKEPGIQSFGGTDSQMSGAQDAFQEVKVYTSGTPAEYGHSSGGLMTIVYRSGTNQFHGSFEDRYLGKDMIHRSFLEQASNTNPFVYHELTGVASGPVILPKYNGRDKTFWLIGWAYHYENGGDASVRQSVPTAAMLNGDFSFNGQVKPAVNPIYNPFTTRQDSTGAWVRDLFPNNQIPKSLFDAAAVKFLAHTPFIAPNQDGVATATGPTQNLVMDQPKDVHRMRWDAKIDHEFTPNHKIFARYSQSRHRAWKGDYLAQFSSWREIDPNAQPQPVDQYNGVISDTAILSPTSNNEFRIGYNRRSLDQQSLVSDQNWAQQLGIPNVNGGTFPYFNIGYGMASLPVYQYVGEDITLQDNFTKILGNHTVKAGYELIRTRYNATSASLPGGSYTFGGTEKPFTSGTGNTFASFLLGGVSSATYTQKLASWLPRWWSHEGYVQDDWKPTANLTINLGLRYSYETPFQTKYNQDSEFNPTAIDPLTGKVGAITHPTGALSKPDRNNFAPRIGLSWKFAPKFVFRSSFGIIHSDIFAATQSIMFDEYQSTATVASPTGDPRSAFYLSSGPGSITYPIRSDGTSPYVTATGNYSGRTASYWDPNMRMPYIMNWQGNVQWEFSPNWLLDFAYQGQAGVGLVNSWNINQVPLNISSNPATLATIYKSLQTYQPYPQFGAITMYSNYGHNSHHSGTVKVNRRTSYGLAFNAYYSYSKTLSECDAEGACTGIDYYNRSLEKAPTNFDIRHHFVGLVSYDLPFGKGRKFMNKSTLLDQALGGWELTIVQTLQSGMPFSVTVSNSPNTYLPGGGVVRALDTTTISQSQVQGWSIGPNRFPTSAQNPYLNASSFAFPTAFNMSGVLGRNTFYGPSLNWFQFSLAKTWKIREKVRFQARFDGYNLPIKQPNYANPASAFDGTTSQTFGRITSCQGSYSNVGSCRPNIYAIGRFEF